MLGIGSRKEGCCAMKMKAIVHEKYGKPEDALKLKNLENGNVLSDAEYGSWIEYYSNKKVILSRNIIYENDPKNIINQTNKIFNSRNLKVTKEILRNLNIKYIFITNRIFPFIIND